MSPRTTRILAIAVIVLFAAVFLLDRQRNSAGPENELLFPDLKEQLDAVTEVTVTDADSEVTIVREEDRWVVPAKGGYAADTGALRDLLIAIAEARKIEQKTSNSEYYDRLGLLPPDEEDSTGILVETAGEGAAVALILGDSVQGEYRYARIADEAQSWLIDRNPNLPDDPAGWLVAGIVDIPASRIQSVTITHEDGETIRLHKESEDAANFALEEIPEGREPSYPSVGNSIASAIDGLSLEDVRPADQARESGQATTATTVYTTFDGLQLTIDSTTADDETWISLEAETVPAEAEEHDVQPEGSAAAPGSPEPDAEPTQQAGTEPADNAEAQSGAAENPDTPNPVEQAETLNTRVSGWQYRIPQYKADQLTRRWEDLLADPEPDPAEE
jgi:hypothetical protein